MVGSQWHHSYAVVLHIGLGRTPLCSAGGARRAHLLIPPIRRADLAQRAALAPQAVRRAFAWVDEPAPRAGLILAQLRRKTVVDTLLDDQRMKVTVEIGNWRLEIEDWRSAISNLQSPISNRVGQRMFDQLLNGIVGRAGEVEA